jgi:hypothetical protein
MVLEFLKLPRTDSLAIIRFGAETEADPSGMQVERMVSIPAISLNSVSATNLSVSGGRVTVALSGSVNDPMANLSPTSVMKRIVVSQFDREIGSLTLTPAAGSSTDWKPYAKSLTFNGTATFDAVDGTQTLELRTDPNEMGFRGIGAINVDCKALTPNPYYTETITVAFNRALSAATAEVATLTLPGQYIGVQASAVTLTETGLNTCVFKSSDGVYQVTVPTTAVLSATSADDLPIAITKSGMAISDLAHMETDVTSLIFVANRTAQVSVSATSVTYRINAAGLSATPKSITLTLPVEIAGPSPTPIAMTESTAGTFAGAIGDNVVTVISSALTGAPPTGSFPGLVLMNGSIMVDATFAPSSPGHIATVNTGTTIKTVSAMISQQATAESTGAPYRVVFDAPAEVREKIASNYEFYQDGSKFELVKQGDKYYRGKNGKPDVMAAYGLDSGKVPGDPKIATSSVLLYAGTVNGYTSNGISVARSIVVQFSPEGIEGDPPQLVNVNINPIMSALGTISRIDNDKKLTLAGKHNLDLPEGNYGGALRLSEIVVDPANFVLKPKANAQENYGELYGRDAETTLNVKIPAWSWVTSEQRSGFIWNEDEQLREVPILWTLPPFDYHTTYSLRSAVEIALNGPVANTGDEKVRKRTLDLFTSWALELDYLELENIKRLYTWTVTKGVYTQTDADANKIPVGFQIGDFRKEIRTEDGQRVDLTRLIEDGFNKYIHQQNAAAYTAWEARRNLGAKMARAGLTFNVDRMTQPDGYLKVLTLATTMADPFYWCGVLAGETTIKLPTAEESTWAAVGFGAGSLVVDALPIGKLIRAGGKLIQKVRNIFKRDVPVEPTKQVNAAAENCSAHCLKGGCFTGDQQVMSENGPISIRDVKVGDCILSRDILGHREGYKMVSAVRKTKPSALVILEFDCVDGGRFQVCGTPGHLIWACGSRKWIGLIELTSDDRVMLPGGRQARLIQRTWRPSGGNDFEAYDLTIDEWSTFFVGDQGGFILAHNSTPQQDTCLSALKVAREKVSVFLNDEKRVLHEFTKGEYRNLGPVEMYRVLGGNRYRRPKQGSIKSIDPKGVDLDTDWLPDCVITMNNGKIIPFIRGFPDFAKYRHPRAPSIVKIKYTGDKGKDFEAALTEALSQGMLRDVPISKSTSAPIGYVWHHNQRMGVMELVEEGAHNVAKELGGAAHTGGWAIYKKLMQFKIPIKYE